METDNKNIEERVSRLEKAVLDHKKIIEKLLQEIELMKQKSSFR